MKDDGRGRIKFSTKENTDKFYFIGKDVKNDNPSALVGIMTPSIFHWTKMVHLYDIMDAVRAEHSDKTPIIACEKDEYTAIEFLQSIADSRMWKFDFGIGNIRFNTFANPDKFYFIGKDSKDDYLSSYIGNSTPGIFRWTRMAHLYDVMDAARTDIDNKTPIIVYGQHRCTAIQFMQIAAKFKMWTFDFGITSK